MTEINLEKSTIRELNEALQAGSSGDKFSIWVCTRNTPLASSSPWKRMNPNQWPDPLSRWSGY